MNMYAHYQARKEALMVRTDAILSSDPRARKMIVPARNWNHSRHDKDPNAIVLGESGSQYRQIVMINPTERTFHSSRFDGSSHEFVLWFGAYGTTRLHVYARGLEDALETCAAWLADHAPGHIMAMGSDEHTDLCKEAFEDAGIPWTGEIDWNDHAQDQAIQSAEADLTSTESGFLTSYEWGIALENPSTEDLYAYVCGA